MLVLSFVWFQKLMLPVYCSVIKYYNEVLLGGHIQQKYEKHSELHDFSHTKKVSR